MRRPTAIVRTVVFIMVDTVEAVSRGWLQSHVSEEVLEGVLPSVTDLNAPCSAVIVRLEALVVAPTLHRSPSCVLRTSRHAVLLILDAATGLAGSALQVAALHVLDHPTVALALPVPIGPPGRT